MLHLKKPPLSAAEQREFERWKERHRLELEATARQRKASPIKQKTFWEKQALERKLRDQARVSHAAVPSADTGAVKEVPEFVQPLTYTGDKMLGIGVMHKSSMVPIFSSEEAVDIAKMRRN